MIDWLQTFSGIKNVSHVNREKEELIELRKEIKRYRKKYSNLDKEMNVDSESDKSDNEDEEDKDKIDELININQKRNQSRARTSVSAEVYGDFNKKGNFKSKVIHKQPDQKKRLEIVVMKSFIFNNLDAKDLNTVLDAIEEKCFNAGDTVIMEGDQGDVLFIVESGELSCSKNLKGKGHTYLRSYKEGESFGELALLYNAPRAATIVAISDSILWALDRETFNHIVKDSAVKKREQYEAFLKSVDILKDVSPYELTQICDALKTVNFSIGEEIIRESTEGDNFYIIAEGQAYAEKILSAGAKPSVVKEYQSGDYFGELALIKDEPRAASVIAKVSIY